MRVLLILTAISFLSMSPAYANMRVVSKDLVAGKSMAMDQVFDKFGCQGKNISPELAWSGAPQGTKSFAIMAYDPDAPTGSGWWHWVVFNIPASTTKILTDASRNGGLPPGSIQGRTDFGTTTYGGACPPLGHGVHHYQFIVYALSVARLTFGDTLLDSNTPAAMIGFVVHANALDSASIEATYKR